MLNRKFISLCCCLGVVIISGCAMNGAVISARTILPAKSSEMIKYRRVAVLPFDGHFGREISTEIESALVRAVHDGRPYYVVAERNRLDQVIAELQRTNSTLINDKTALKVGKMLGVQAIIMGTVKQPNVSDTPYLEQRTECASYATKYDKNGRRHDSCASYHNVPIQCLKRTAEITITPKVVDVETGRIVFSTPLSMPQVEKVCPDQNIAAKSRDQLLENARKEVLSEFRRHIAPYEAIFSIVLMEEKVGMTDVTSSQFVRGLEYAKANRLDRACEIWEEALASSPRSPTLVYSSGVCHEASGNYPAALDSYEQADRILNKPHTAITQGLNRVQKLIDEQAKLAGQRR